MSVHFRQVDSDVGTLFVGGIYAIFIILGLLRTEPISITYQLNKRCKTLPEKASLPYFIKVLDMQEQYKAVIEQVEQNKLDKEDFKGFAFE